MPCVSYEFSHSFTDSCPLIIELCFEILDMAFFYIIRRSEAFC